MSAPSNAIRPWSDGTVPTMRFIIVVFPAPFGPTTPSATPSSSRRLTSSITRRDPNDLPM